MATITGTSGDDNLIGTSSDDYLYGYEGNDSLNGRGGTNWLYGGPGNDTLYSNYAYFGGTGNYLYGGPGNDTYWSSPRDQIVEYANEGYDTVVFCHDYDITPGSYYYYLPDNFEHLVLNFRVYADTNEPLNCSYSAYGNSLDNWMEGNIFNNIIYGQAGNDQLWGWAGNDTLYGGTGNDALDFNVSAGTVDDACAGEDTMYGGAGDDTYGVDSPNDKVIEYAGEGTDTVYAINMTYTLTANVENLHLIGVANTSTNGTGNNLNNQIIGNTGANTLWGLDGNDELWGNAGNDTLYGGTGNDALDFNVSANTVDMACAGEDTMYGGAGNDTYGVDSPKDLVIENAGEGTDTVYAINMTYTLTANVENLNLIGVANTSTNGTGNNLNNQIFGNTGANTLWGLDGNDVLWGNSGNDILYGGAGNDTLDCNTGAVSSSAGADTMYGGTGNDSYGVDNTGDKVIENAGEGTDLVYSTITYTLTANVENLTLIGTADLNGTGNELDNVITGNSGVNILYGNAGDDTLVGNFGRDWLYGGSGNDTLYGDHNWDVGYGISDYSYGDYMYGGAGDDTYYVDDIHDQVVEYAGEGYDMVRFVYGDYYGKDITPGSYYYYMPDNVERLKFGIISHYDTGKEFNCSYSAVGNGLDNLIEGNRYNNIIYGQAGNDNLWGGDGNDTLYGGVGDDGLDYDTRIGAVFSFAGGADTMYGGAGNDKYGVDNANDKVIEYAGGGYDRVYATVTHTLSANVEFLWLQGTANINGTGNNLDNYMVGNSGNNTLNGGAGADTLVGQGGNDVLMGAAGNDLLSGGVGADTMYGGAGNDWYSVDNVNDKVVENAGGGNDRINS